VRVQLGQADLIGKGYHRFCYHHPGNPDLCIKIPMTPDDEEHLREQAYYRRLLRRNVSFEMVAKFHGTIETNYGTGAVFDLIRDPDGRISKTLEAYLSSDSETRVNYSGLARAFAALKRYLVSEIIITRNLNVTNVLYKRRGPADGTLVIIDNIGNYDFIPICNYVDFLAVKKIMRKWRRFEKTLARTYPENPNLLRMLDHPDGSSVQLDGTDVT
jgi:hypothetical protein